ncbi:MAG: hypothetical protein HKN41_10345 [Ilumatobacter sp.]|nr:hypothetical protein [Ilumatobacter sp.]
MSVRSRGRGVAAAFGLFVLLAGLIAGGVLYIVAEQRPGRAVDGFARAPVGCTTTLEFSETGSFYLYEEAGAEIDPAAGGCEPFASIGREFDVEFTGNLTPASIEPDTSVTYDIDGRDGRSVERIEITRAGQYSVAVLGDDITVVAALGRNPTDGVDELRQAALIAAVVGLVLGLLLLVLSGRRSKRAAEAVMPQGPGWGPSQRPVDSWPPEAPNLQQRPVNPHAPSEPARAERAAGSDGGTWGPPSGDAETLPAPEEPAEPVLPDTPGKTSGT